MSKLEEIEARRAERKAKADAARDDQEASDLEAIEALEIGSGDSLSTLRVNGFVPGQPVRVAFKAPSEAYYRRFCSMVRKAGPNLEARGAAQDLLAQSCWVYPADGAAQKAFLVAFPGTLVSIAIECAKLAELRSDEEGKG